MTRFLDQLEVRIDKLSEDPPKGHVTRELHKEISEMHRKDILEIVQAIRQRIDNRETTIEGAPYVPVSDVLRRLDAVERTIGQLAQSGHSANIHAPSATTQ